MAKNSFVPEGTANSYDEASLKCREDLNPLQTNGFLIISGGIERVQRPKMG